MNNTHPNYSLTKCKNDTETDEGFINPLPRAVLRPNSFVLLDGNWNFEHDPKNVGLAESWYVSHKYTGTADWPGSVESHMVAIDPNSSNWRDKVIVWYERDFPLPDMEEKMPNSQLQ